MREAIQSLLEFKMKFIQFLIEAKRNGYASKGEGSEIKNPDGSKELRYSIEQFTYVDKYFNFNPFIGQEIVWKNNRLFWGMNYYGKVTYGNPKEIYSFLKKALQKVDFKSLFRGPKYFKNNEFEYLNEFSGDINLFKGEETINFKGEKVYSLLYSGGTIKEKS